MAATMTSLLRQLVAGPRAPHPEADLDLCYVSSDIIATSGPSATWPQRAYRNPLDKLVEFLDERHGQDWAIWEFRAEGTGYPDEEVYGRIRHYPWPDHHPPPFRVIPMIMASMRNWLHGGELLGGPEKSADIAGQSTTTTQADANVGAKVGAKADKSKRVVVVHCKAGKGRSGTVACSYLISECGWRPEEALTRFTERRMRPKFGAGVSIPSQLRTISYVDRWTHHGKRYVDRPIEIVEIHVWGLRNGVKVDVEGYADAGRRIETLHTFKKAERMIVEGHPPDSGGVKDMIFDMAGVPVARVMDGEPDGGDALHEMKTASDTDASNGGLGKMESGETTPNGPAKGLSARTATMLLQASNNISTLKRKATTTTTHSSNSETKTPATPKTQNNNDSPDSSGDEDGQAEPEPGGMAVILKPENPIRVPNSDVNISVERRNRTSSSLGLTMVTAVAHVWFNAFFEGNGPEQGGRADAGGVFSIDWDAMDGIKGSSRKGAKALDKIAVVWRVAGADTTAEDVKIEETAAGGEVVIEPPEGVPVPQMQAADWKGENRGDPEREKGLGLRAANPASADVSKASSVKSQDLRDADSAAEGPAAGVERRQKTEYDEVDDEDPMAGVRVSGPAGEEQLNGGTTASSVDQKTDVPPEKGAGPSESIQVEDYGKRS